MTAKPIPDGYHAITPYLVVHDVETMLKFLADAFAAEVLYEHRGPTGKIGHAELQIGDSRLMVGQSRDGVRATFSMQYCYVLDVDAAYRRALAAGASSIEEPRDQPYGDRSAAVRDASGNEWWLATHLEDVTPEEVERRFRKQG